ncbi:MAG: ribosome-binding factor A [Pseudomonadota bacterium]|nr:ribosome-binding factor A [Pseudomonadota bacterium]
MAKNKFSEGPGPSQRQLRVGELIRRTLSEVLQRGDIHDPDLKIATAYIMPLGGQGRDQAVDLLARNKNELRRMIGKVTNLKYTPDLRFRLDETFDQLDETRRLFDQDDVRRDLDADDQDQDD